MSSKQLKTSTNLNIEVDSNIPKLYEEMKLMSKYSYLVCELNPKEPSKLQLLKAADSESTWEDFLQELKDDRAQFILYNFEYPINIGTKKRVVLLAWSPMTSSVKDRLVHSTATGCLKASCQDLNVIVQASDQSMVTKSIFLDKVLRF